MIDLFRPFLVPDAIIRNLSRVLRYDENGRAFIGEGPLVKRFEAAFAAVIDADPAGVVAVNSCSSALAASLQLAGLDPIEHWRTGRTYQYEVITTPMTCTATTEAIVNAGAIPVYADIDPVSGCIDPADVARKITPRTRAVMAVNWGGHPVAVPALRLAAPGLPLIIDAAHGPMCDAPLADYLCFSLGPIKHATAGHGGFIVTHADDARRARRLRWHSLDRESTADFRCEQDIAEPGHLWHMDDINAAIGLANLPHAEWVVARHRQNAAYYDRALAGLPGLATPSPDEDSSYWCYFLLVEDRAGFQAWMASKGIATSPVHRRNDTQPAYRFPNGPLPGVDAYAAHNVAIPVGWWVTEQDREHVAGAVQEWVYTRWEGRAA